MEILDKIYQARQAASELALNQHEAGNISDLELAFQQMAHQQIKLNLARQKIATESVRNQLNQLMGVWGEANSWTLKTKLPELPKKEFELDELGAKAIHNNLNLSALNLENQSIRQRLSLARKGRIKDLEVGFNTEKEPEGERLTGGIVEFGMPVFDRNQGEIAKFESLLRQNDRRIKAIAVEIRSQLSSLTFRQKKVREQVEYYKKSVMPLREKIVSLSQRHYNAMFIGTYELLQAKQSELSAQMDYINILRDFWLTHTDLKHLLAGRTIRSEETGHKPVVHPDGKDGKDDH